MAKQDLLTANRRQVLVMIYLLLIALVVLAALNWSGKISPTTGGVFGDTTLRLKISDHQADGTPLTNSISGTDVPRYDDDIVIPLQRNGDGSLGDLPRFQGTIEYFNQ